MFPHRELHPVQDHSLPVHTVQHAGLACLHTTDGGDVLTPKTGVVHVLNSRGESSRGSGEGAGGSPFCCDRPKVSRPGYGFHKQTQFPLDAAL